MTEKDVLHKIKLLEELINDTSDLYTNEWELIAIEKIKGFVKIDPSNKSTNSKLNSEHLTFLNKLWKDYKLRFNKGEDEGDSIHIRQWDTHITGNSTERGLLWRRYKTYVPDTTDESIDTFLDNGELEFNTGVFSNLKHMGLSFTNDDILRIRTNKKQGDLIMVEDPFDDTKTFYAVVTEARSDGGRRRMLFWHKIDDKETIGQSIITKADVVDGNALWAENIKKKT